MIDPFEVVLDEPGLPFDGLTYVKARVLNDALVGRRVKVCGGSHDLRPREVMFLRLQLPGERARTLLDAAWDLVFLHYEADEGCARIGSTWHVSPSLIERFVVVKAPELCPCWNCGAWWPQGHLRDIGPSMWWELGPDAYESRLECRGCFAR